jgi:hypothetical protein
MGRQGRGYLRERLVGSTSHAPVPLLLVPIAAAET